MGKGGKKPKVPWYFMTIHYGICHGPIDAINQIKIKEKPIFCTNMVRPSNLYVNWPELFGGETREGGVEGVIECYFGGPDQYSSQDMAIRKGKTSLTFPGYRGIAHLYFRGYTDVEIPLRPGRGYTDFIAQNGVWVGLIQTLLSLWNDQSPGGGAIAIAHEDLPASPVGDIFSPSNPRPNGGGFHWITNNPYLPSAWVHVTRIGRPIEGIPAVIRHAPYGDVLGQQSGDFPHNGQVIPGFNRPHTFIDLTDFAEQVDAGNVVIRMEASLRAEYDDDYDIIDVNEGDPAGVSCAIWVYAVGEDGLQTSPVFSDGSASQGFSGDGNVSGEFTRTVAPGVRGLRINVGSALSAAIVSRVVNVQTRYEMVFIALGPPLCEGNGTIGTPPDMNPAQIIAECLTNRQWGMGGALASLDEAAFDYAGEYLYNEGFGLSMLWQGQTTIEKFISEVLDHIQGMLFLSPKTGLWKLKLIRDDYDVEDLRTLNPSNCVAKNRQRKAEGEIINEIIISYTDPVTEEPKTVTFHDLGRISQIGEIVSDTRNYYGCRSEALANLLGQRDIRSSSYPLFSCEIEADRSFRDVEPGDVLLLDWPEDGIVGMPVRVGKVNYGRTGDSKVRFSVTEDVFGLELTDYTQQARSQWTNPDIPPEPLAYERVIEAPLPMILRSGYTIDDISDDDYPEVLTAVFGDDPAQKVEQIELYGEEVLANGDSVLGTIAYLDKTNVAVTTDALVVEAFSELPGIFVRGLARPEQALPGHFIYVDGTNEEGEWIMLDALDIDTDVWTAARGMFDTVPHAWPIGTPLWYVSDTIDSFDPTQNVAGVTTEFRLLPKVPFGTLEPDAATPISHTPGERPYLPFRPANVQIDGNGFGLTEYRESDPGGIPATVEVTWANRNRLLEDGQAVRWTDADVTPEVGYTVTIRVYERVTSVLMDEITGLTGTSYDLATAGLADFNFYDVEVLAERDGFESLQNITLQLNLLRLGYGNNYGYDYGENNGD